MQYNVELCMKISEKRWVESLRNGSACFNPVEKFIEKAEKEGNNEQGDRYEGVFARIKSDDARLKALRIRLGEDLEEIADGDYMILRRKTSRKVPIFCLYGIRRNEIEIDVTSVREDNGEYMGTARYDFPPEMYNSFLNISEVWGFYASSGHLFQAIENALQRKCLSYVKTVICYDIDLTKEFYFEPDYDYPELAHKRMDLEYQHEIRYRLIGFPREEKYLLDYEPLSAHSCGIAPGTLYLELNCKCMPLED